MCLAKNVFLHNLNKTRLSNMFLNFHFEIEIKPEFEYTVEKI